MKRVLFILAAIMLVFAVVGCNSNGAPTTVPERQQPGTEVPGGEEPGGEEPVTWETAVGMTTGIAVQGSNAVFANGIIDFTHVGVSDYDDGALFTVAATGATSASTIKIKYICQKTTGTPKLTLKNGGWSTDLLVPNGGDCNWYPELTTDVPDILTVKGSWYTDPTTGIWFQRNGDTNAFKIKIISVTVE